MAVVISGALRRDELEVIMRDNAGWRFDSSLVKVRTFIEACEAWLATPLAELDHSGTRTRLEPRIVQERLQKAINWYEMKSAIAARSRVLYADTSNFMETG